MEVEGVLAEVVDDDPIFGSEGGVAGAAIGALGELSFEGFSGGAVKGGAGDYVGETKQLLRVARLIHEL